MSSPEKAAGIKAILFLMSLNGDEESYEEAEKGWDSMSMLEQSRTMTAYKSMNFMSLIFGHKKLKLEIQRVNENE